MNYMLKLILTKLFLPTLVKSIIVLQDYYKYLVKALDRIEDGSFGVCMSCHELIPEERMLEVPNATKCVSCKENEKLNLSK